MSAKMAARIGNGFPLAVSITATSGRWRLTPPGATKSMSARCPPLFTLAKMGAAHSESSRDFASCLNTANGPFLRHRTRLTSAVLPWTRGFRTRSLSASKKGASPAVGIGAKVGRISVDRRVRWRIPSTTILQVSNPTKWDSMKTVESTAMCTGFSPSAQR